MPQDCNLSNEAREYLELRRDEEFTKLRRCVTLEKDQAAREKAEAKRKAKAVKACAAEVAKVAKKRVPPAPISPQALPASPRRSHRPEMPRKRHFRHPNWICAWSMASPRPISAKKMESLLPLMKNLKNSKPVEEEDLECRCIKLLVSAPTAMSSMKLHVMLLTVSVAENSISFYCISSSFSVLWFFAPLGI
jgi:hypothetical protein